MSWRGGFLSCLTFRPSSFPPSRSSSYTDSDSTFSFFVIVCFALGWFFPFVIRVGDPVLCHYYVHYPSCVFVSMSAGELLPASAYFHARSPWARAWGSSQQFVLGKVLIADVGIKN